MMAHESAVATMGKFISDEQVGLLMVLAEYGTKEFVLSLDADAGRETNEAYDRLRACLPKVTVVQFDRGDPDDNSSILPQLMAQRVTPGVTDRIRLRLSGDALKNARKVVASGLTVQYTRRRNRRGSR
jgi:hypothetical protein